MSTQVEDDASVEELLNAIRNPDLGGQGGSPTGVCLFMQRVQTLPKNIQEAITIAASDTDVTNDDIVLFITQTTDVRVNTGMVQKHRNRKRGCVVCGQGAWG